MTVPPQDGRGIVKGVRTDNAPVGLVTILKYFVVYAFFVFFSLVAIIRNMHT